MATRNALYLHEEILLLALKDEKGIADEVSRRDRAPQPASLPRPLEITRVRPRRGPPVPMH